MLERSKMRLQLTFAGNPTKARFFGTGKFDNGEHT
jgi:hypothetical protein